MSPASRTRALVPSRVAIVALVAGSVALVVAVSLLLVRSGAFDPESEAASASEAPEFKLTTLDGVELSLGGLRGKPVVVSFWGSWCAPCRTQIPLLEQAYRASQSRGVVFIGAAVEDSEEAARSSAQQLGITYPIGLDDGSEIAKIYGLRGLPGTIFITRDGKLLRRWPGAISEEQLAELIDRIAR